MSNFGLFYRGVKNVTNESKCNYNHGKNISWKILLTKQRAGNNKSSTLSRPGFDQQTDDALHKLAVRGEKSAGPSIVHLLVSDCGLLYIFRRSLCYLTGRQRVLINELITMIYCKWYKSCNSYMYSCWFLAQKYNFFNGSQCASLANSVARE